MLFGMNNDVDEKTDEELSELLSEYEGSAFSWSRIGLGIVTLIVVVLMLFGLRGSGSDLKLLFGLSDPMHMDFLEVSEPENTAKEEYETNLESPAHLMLYALECQKSGEGVTDEIFDKAEQIDVDNGFYHYIAAADDSVEVIKKKLMTLSGTLSEREEFEKVVAHEVLDRERYGAALRHILEAGKKRGIEDHISELRLDKLRELKAAIPQDYLGRISTMAEVWGGEIYSVELMKVSQLLSAKFYELSQGGTQEEYRVWKEQYLNLLDAFAEDEMLLIDTLVLQAILREPLPNMRAAAENLGLEDEARKITVLLDKLFREKQAQKAEREAVENHAEEAAEYSKYGYVHDASYSSVIRYLPVSVSLGYEVDSAPCRLAEHALAGRLGVHVVFLFLLLVCVGMWIYYFNKPAWRRRMSLQILGALSFSDGAQIVLLGVVLPIMMYILVNEYSSLGAREWSLFSADGMLAGCQFVGMFFWVITFASVLLRRSLARSLPEIAMPVRWSQWVMPVLSFLAMLLVGFSDSVEESLTWMLSFVVLTLVALTWACLSIAQCFGKTHRVWHLSYCRGLISVYAVLMILMFGLSKYYYAQECKYLAEDETMLFKEEYLGANLLEHLVSQELKQHVLTQIDEVR